MTDSIRNNNRSKTIRFEKILITQEGFSKLLSNWWKEYKLEDDIGQTWKFKLQYLRKKMRG